MGGQARRTRKWNQHGGSECLLLVDKTVSQATPSSTGRPGPGARGLGLAGLGSESAIDVNAALHFAESCNAARL
jgi:hypothetical protein